MQTGFPDYMQIRDLLIKFKQNLEDINNQKQLMTCNSLLRACGLKWQDFKCTDKSVFFRNGKIDILNEKLNGDLQIVFNDLKKLQILRLKWRKVIMVTMFCSNFYSRKKRKQREIQNENCVAHGVDIENQIIKPIIKQKRKSHNIRQKDRTKPYEKNTITIPSIPDNIENQLRTLLRQEREKNCQLNSDYRILQKKNLELMSMVNSLKKENQELIQHKK